MNASQTPLDLARELQRFNVSPLPILAGTKRPATAWRQWQHYGPPPAQLPNLFERPGITVGALTGEPSDRLLVLDCDNRKTLDATIHRLGAPITWIVETARGGHIYLRTPVPVKGTRAEGMDVKAQKGYVLAPGAIHPTGVRYAWLQRANKIHEIADLAALDWLELQPVPTRPDAMPSRAWDLLTQDRTQVRKPTGEFYASESEREYAAVCALVNADWDYARILGAFEKHALTHGHYKKKIAERGTETARAWLRAEYDAARVFVLENISAETETVRKVRAFALAKSWQGATGATDRACYLAHLEIAERTGKLTYGASARELAEIAGVNKFTANKANHRLTQANLIALAKQCTATQAHRWTLKTTDAGLVQSFTQCVRDCTSPASLTHDAFRRQGLGKAAAQIYDTLHTATRGLTIRTLAQRTGRHAVTVARQIKHMHALGMVTPGEISRRAVCWQIVPEVRLNEIAHRLETSGLGANQKNEHKKQRAKHRQDLNAGRGVA